MDRSLTDQWEPREAELSTVLKRRWKQPPGDVTLWFESPPRGAESDSREKERERTGEGVDRPQNSWNIFKPTFHRGAHRDRSLLQQQQPQPRHA